MSTFFIEFRDPLFGIIVFFAIVFVIAMASYWWNKYSSKEKSKSLDRFLNDLKKTPTDKELSLLISKGEMSEKSWILLARLYTKNGDFEKSLDIYNELLKICDESSVKEIMYLLGSTYYKAGFLQRAEDVFLSILKTSPRTKPALRYLLLIYENKKDFQSAMDVLEPLDELGEDISLETDYLRVLELLYNGSKTNDEKIKELLEIYKKEKHLTYLIFEYIFRVNPKEAWNSIDATQAELIIDILWRLDKGSLDFDIISKYALLKELYSARGDISLAKKSSIFEFDVLINLDKKANADLSFEYICDNCKNIHPFAFHRCSNCHSIDTVRIELSLSKSFQGELSEEYNSFQ